MTKCVSPDGPAVIGDYLVDEALTFVDVETSDNIKRGPAADHPSQPWLAEISLIFLILQADEWKAIGGYHAFVRPNSFWHMQPGATRINGITDELLHQEGVAVSDVLDRWEGALKGGFTPVAFNYAFDGKIMRGAMRRAGRPDYRNTPYGDVMLDAHGFTKLRNSKGGGKFPNLVEACQFFGVPLPTGAGTPYKAIRDNEAQIKVFRAMVKQGHKLQIRTYGDDFEPAFAPRIKPAVADKNYKPPNPRSLDDLPAHRQPTKR